MTDEGAERLATENDGHHKLQKDEQSAQKSLKPYKLLKQRRIVYPTMRERVLRGGERFSFLRAKKINCTQGVLSLMHTQSRKALKQTRKQSRKLLRVLRLRLRLLLRRVLNEISKPGRWRAQWRRRRQTRRRQPNARQFVLAADYGSLADSLSGGGGGA